MAGIEQKQYSTGDTWNVYLNDVNGWIDVTTAIGGVKLYGKSGATTLGPLACTIQTVQSFTANTTISSNVVSGVSAFTGISDNSTISGPGIPANTFVGSFDSTAQTIHLVDASGNAVNATATATGAALKANVGWCTHTPASADVANTGAFLSEAAIHWDNTDTSVTIVPNKAASNPTITIDANVTGAAE